MLFAYANKEITEKFQNKGFLFHIIKIVILTIVFIFGLTYYDKPQLVLMCGNIYGNIILFLINTFRGCEIIFSVSAIIARKWQIDPTNPCKNFILWVGRNTIGIFLTHKMFLQEIVVPIFTNMGYSTSSFIVAILCTLITFPVSCFLVYIINRYVPRLFGREY